MHVFLLRSLALGVALSVIIATPLFCGAGLIPQDSWLNEAVDYLLARGYGQRQLQAERPYDLDLAESLFAELEQEAAAASLLSARARLYLELWHKEGSRHPDRFKRQEAEGELRAGMILRPFLSYHDRRVELSVFGEQGLPFLVSPYVNAEIGDNFYLESVFGVVWFSERGYANQNFPTENIEQRRLLVHAERALVRWRFYRECHLGIGRNTLRWGPGRRGGLLFSGAAGPMDMVELSLQLGSVKLTSITGLLDDGGDNYFSVKRLSALVRPGLELGAANLTVYSGRGMDLTYLNPVAIHRISHDKKRVDDNLIYNFDLRWQMKRWLRVYGEFLVDDFILWGGDEEADTLAGMGGVGLAGGAFALTVEYACIGKNVYLVMRPENNFLRNTLVRPRQAGYLLVGHPLGPDADALDLYLEYYPQRRLSLLAELSFARRGEGDIAAGWDPLHTEGRYDFPSGLVERQSRAGLGLSWLIGVKTRLSLAYSASRYRDWQHLPGARNYVEEWRFVGVRFW